MTAITTPPRPTDPNNPTIRRSDLLSWAKVGVMIGTLLLTGATVIAKSAGDRADVLNAITSLERKVAGYDQMWQHYSPSEEMFIGAARGIDKTNRRIDDLEKEQARQDERTKAIVESVKDGFAKLDTRLNRIETNLDADHSDRRRPP